MKKTSMYLVLTLLLPVLLQAQYMGGNGRGDASISLTNAHLSVHNITVEFPKKYELYQNYPNPFNPSTKIKFQIKKQGFVSLKVYDILGKEVAILVNENLKEGIYEILFSTNQYTYNKLASGIYFYKLDTDTYKDTKRMIILN
jgi:hypothetical protein